ncbi:response regulator [Larkinella harenae]
MLKNSCVYVVDDDEDDQFLLQQAFGQHSPGCELKMLSNGQQLLDALEDSTQLPALVLLDLNMPFMGGFEALAQIRDIPAYDSLPVVILTTSSQPDDRQRAHQLGANGFVTKPFLLQEYSQLMILLRQKFLES